jgi:hypothetical protein
MYIDKPVTIPKSLKSIRGITASNVHSKHTTPTGERCPAPTQKGQCLSCRTCWTPDTVVSYEQH